MLCYDANTHFLQLQECLAVLKKLVIVRSLLGLLMIKQHHFFEACERGDLDSVQHYVYLKQCAPLGLDNLGLRLACKNGHRDVVAFLLRSDGIATSTGLMKAIWAAIEMRRYDIVSMLTPHVDLDANDGYLLKWAVVRGDNTLVAQLSPHFNSHQHLFEALLDAVRNNDLAIVTTLIEYIDPQTNDGEAFHLACGRGHAAIVQCLLPYVDPKSKNSEGLLWACVGNHTNVIDLIWNHCDVSIVLNTQLLFSSDKGFEYLRNVWQPAEQKKSLLDAVGDLGIDTDVRKI